jgi:hypothetical protein
MITTRSIMTSTRLSVSGLVSLMASALLIGPSSLSNAGVVAAPLNGVVSGLSVVWNNTNTLQIQPGEAYVAGHQFTMAAVVQVGVPVAANTAYYVYLTFDTHTGTFLLSPWVIVPIAPGNNGIGTGIVNGAGDACNAIFLGSIVTDSFSNLVPFVRSGEEVILAMDENNAGCLIMADGAGEASVAFANPGAFAMTIDFDSVNTQSCNGTNNNGADHLVLPYPLTASAALIDFELTSADANLSHYLFVAYAGIVPPKPSAYQLTMSLQPNGVQYYPMNRVNPVVKQRVNNNNNPVAAPQFFPEFQIIISPMPTVGKAVTVSGYYRGYVESIGHLTQE